MQNTWKRYKRRRAGLNTKRGHFPAKILKRFKSFLTKTREHGNLWILRSRWKLFNELETNKKLKKWGAEG